MWSLCVSCLLVFTAFNQAHTWHPDASAVSCTFLISASIAVLCQHSEVCDTQKDGAVLFPVHVRLSHRRSLQIQQHNCNDASESFLVPAPICCACSCRFSHTNNCMLSDCFCRLIRIRTQRHTAQAMLLQMRAQLCWQQQTQ